MKSGMAMVDLKGLYKVTAKGRVYWYAWRGGPRILAPHGTPAFAAEYAAHHAARKGGDKERISGLIVDWKRSEAWTLAPEKGGLAASTRQSWIRALDEIQIHFGQVRIEAFNDERAARRNIKTWLKRWADRPRTADRNKQVLSVLLSFAVDQELLGRNPCFGIPNIYSSNRAEIIWTPDDIAAFEKVASPELVWALKLACLTGLRQSDLLKLSWSHIGDLAIEIKTGKSRVRGRVQRTARIPMYAELRALLATIPKRGFTVLTNTSGQPWRAFKRSWNTALGRAGLKDKGLHFHDSRGTFATFIYLAGFSIREIAEMLGWATDRVERIIGRYVMHDAMLRDRIRRMDEARTESAKQTPKPTGVA